MGNNLRKLEMRLLAIERGRTGGQPTCGVVRFGRHETPDKAIERARLEGMTGSILVVPEPMSEEDWVAMMKDAIIQDALKIPYERASHEHKQATRGHRQ